MAVSDNKLSGVLLMTFITSRREFVAMNIRFDLMCGQLGSLYWNLYKTDSLSQMISHQSS